MSDHKQHLNYIAQKAASLYGQKWGRLPGWTRDKWIETVRNTARGSSGVNEMERCAGQAIDEWYKVREAQPIVEVVEEAETAEVLPKQKPKKK